MFFFPQMLIFKKNKASCWMWHFLEELTAILVYRHKFKKQITFRFSMKSQNYRWKILYAFKWQKQLAENIAFFNIFHCATKTEWSKWHFQIHSFIKILIKICISSYTGLVAGLFWWLMQVLTHIMLYYLAMLVFLISLSCLYFLVPILCLPVIPISLLQTCQ